MTSIFIFRRDLRLYDNTTLILADQQEEKIIPIFIFDPHQLERNDKSNNCVQFMVESLKDLKNQLQNIGSDLHTCYGNPWEVIDKLIDKWEVNHIYMNVDYSKYSQYRDNKIQNICQKHNISLTMREDCVLNDVETIKTTSGKHYEKFTPYYNTAIKNKVRLPQKYIYHHLIKKQIPDKIKFTKLDNLYTSNDELYIHGGRMNGLKLLNQLNKQKQYNQLKDTPTHDTTLLSPHNKFGTISIREVYHKIKSILGNSSDLLRQLYWRDFYYTIVFHQPEYIDMMVGKYANLKWNNNPKLLKQWKTGNTGIPIVDAGIIQLNRTGWIHNRVRMVIATMITKVFHIDWRIGELYFRKNLVDYDVTQNIMNWYWISGEVPFASPYFRVLNPIIQTKKHDPECLYSKKWKKNDDCIIEPIVDISSSIQKAIQQYTKK